MGHGALQSRGGQIDLCITCVSMAVRAVVLLNACPEELYRDSTGEVRTLTQHACHTATKRNVSIVDLPVNRRQMWRFSAA